MSRIGKKPVAVPDKVKVSVSGSTLSAEGPKGKQSLSYPEGIRPAFDEKQKIVTIARDEARATGALHGTFRALTANLLTGVAAGSEKKLEIQGVGFRAAMKGSQVSLSVGFANAIVVDVPPGVTVQCPDATHIVVAGIDRQKVGEVAARIRSVRPPDVYLGKGIRYQVEDVRKKAGKASLGAEAGS